MKALLLLGGLGTRLRPFTLTTPKPLLPILNKPFIHYQLSLLKKEGFDEVILGTGYKGGEFKKIMSSIKHMKMKIHLSLEKEPLGTAGGIRNAYKYLKGKEPFFVFNGDILADFNLQKILAAHREKQASATIGLVKVANPAAYGLVVTDSTMKIEKFVEKPKPEEITSDKINAGVYVFEPEILEEIPSGKNVSVERETFPQILAKGKSMFGYVHDGYWLDVGTLQKFRTAVFDLMDGKIDLGYRPSADNIEKHDSCHISEDIRVEGKLIAGKNTIIGKDVRIKGKVVLGENCFIGNSCIIEDSIIFDKTIIKDKTVITNSFVGKNVLIETNCILKNVAIADGSILYPFSKSVVGADPCVCPKDGG